MKLNHKLTKNFLLATTLLLILWKGDEFWEILSSFQREVEGI